MRRRTMVAVALFLIGGAAVQSAQAAAVELLSRRYEFKPGVILATAVSTANGLRLDSLYFDVPVAADEQLTRTQGMVTVQVSVSNTGEAPARLGLAVALFDDAGRLLGVASGGSKLTPLRPGHRKAYNLLFDAVNSEAHRATTFQVSLEGKP